MVYSGTSCVREERVGVRKPLSTRRITELRRRAPGAYPLLRFCTRRASNVSVRRQTRTFRGYFLLFAPEIQGG